MSPRLLSTLGLALLAQGCSREAPRPVWPGALCDARLPATAELAPVAPDLVIPASRLLIDVRVDTATILGELERAVPRRVIERRGVAVGPAGKLDFSIDRGPFALKLQGDELAIDVDLEGDAELCKPFGPLGCVGYASCKPAAHARAAVTLLLASDFRLPPSRVDIPLTRRCTLTALSVDVSGDLQVEADKRATDIRASIDGGVPVVGPIVRDIWTALGTSVPLGAATCARVYPTAIVQTGPRVRDNAITIGVGAEGEVVVESPCGKARPSPPMPSPRLDRALEPGVSLSIPIVLAWEEVARRVARSLALVEPSMGGDVVHVTDVRAAPSSDGRARLVLTIAGRACGELALVGTPRFERDAFVFPDLTAETPSAGMAPLEALLRVHARAVAPIDPAGVSKRIDRIAASLLGKADPSSREPEVHVAMAAAEVTGAHVTRAGLVALLDARGAATVTLR